MLSKAENFFPLPKEAYNRDTVEVLMTSPKGDRRIWGRLIENSDQGPDEVFLSIEHSTDTGWLSSVVVHLKKENLNTIQGIKVHIIRPPQIERQLNMAVMRHGYYSNEHGIRRIKGAAIVFPAEYEILSEAGFMKEGKDKLPEKIETEKAVANVFAIIEKALRDPQTLDTVVLNSQTLLEPFAVNKADTPYFSRKN